MNRRFLHRNLNVPPAPPPSPYAGVTDADLEVMVEQRIAKAFDLPLPQFAAPPDLAALAVKRGQAERIRAWGESLPDPRARKIAVAAAADRREAEVVAGIEAYLSSDARPHVPPLPLIEVP